jgi:hypothetical protein
MSVSVIIIISMIIIYNKLNINCQNTPFNNKSLQCIDKFDSFIMIVRYTIVIYIGLTVFVINVITNNLKIK